MADPKARFGITASDETKDAIASVKRGLKSIDDSSKSAARGINASLGILAGVSLKNMFRNVLQATAESTQGQRGFAQALEETKRSARDLLAAKDGLPGATANMRELAAVLKDPAVVGAADSLFSTMITGTTKLVSLLAQTAAGLKIIVTGRGGNAQVDVDNQIRDLESERDQLQHSRNPNANTRMAEIDRQIAQLQRDFDSLAPHKRGTGGGGRSSASRFDTGDFVDFRTSEARRELAEKADKEAEKASLAALDRAASRIRENDDLNKHAAEGFNDVLKDLDKSNEKMLDDVVERTEVSVKDVGEQFKEMSAFGEQAARNIQDSLAGFLFDPFQSGLDGMLSGFLDVMRRMVAEVASQKILTSLFGSSSGGLSGVLGSVGKLLGFANGGSFTVGGQSGTDANLVAFKATRGERVTVTTPGQQSGFNYRGGDVYVTGNGVTREDVVSALSQQHKITVAQISGMIRGGAFS